MIRHSLFIIIHSPHRFIKLSLVCRKYNHSLPRPNLMSTPARTGALACMACSQTPSRCEPRIHTSAPLELPVFARPLSFTFFYNIFSFFFSSFPDVLESKTAAKSTTCTHTVTNILTNTSCHYHPNYRCAFLPCQVNVECLKTESFAVLLEKY